MKIKTVCEEITAATIPVFDERVNVLLEDGWQLAKREIIPGYDLGGVYFTPSFYAELVKLDEADMETLEAELPTCKDAVESLRFACLCAEACSEDGCPMNAWCQKNIPDGPPPSEWTGLE